MTNTTINKIILSAATAMFLTACGSSGTAPSAKDIASAKIQAYAEDGTKPKPTVADYTAAGVTGVTDANLAAYNVLVEAKTGSEVDELTELTALVAEIPAAVVDTTAPVVTPAAATLTVAFGGTYTDGGATVTDNKDTGLTATASGTVDTSIAADYTITYTATDAAGNVGTGTTLVTVSPEVVVADITAPTVTPAAATLTVAFGGTYTDGGATVTDNKDTGLTATVSGTVDTSIAADYTITYTATDAAGNVGTGTTVVTVSPAGYVTNTDGIYDEKTTLTWDNNISTTCTLPKRVPTIEEFQSIIDYAKFQPAVNASFTNITEGDYMTLDGWTVNLSFGDVSKGIDAATTNTICVTGTATLPTGTFTKTGDEVTDSTRNLVWKDSGITQETYANAQSLCSGDWRLPTIIELDSIYDRETNATNAIFTNIPAFFWSQTPGAENGQYADTHVWSVRFTDDGTIEGIRKDDESGLFTRCVKDAE